MYTAAQTCLFGCSFVVAENFFFLFHLRLCLVVFTSHTHRTVRHTHTHTSLTLWMPKVEGVFASRWTKPGLFDRLISNQWLQPVTLWSSMPPLPFFSLLFPLSWTHLYQLLKHDSLFCSFLSLSLLTLVCQVFCHLCFFYDKLTSP